MAVDCIPVQRPRSGVEQPPLKTVSSTSADVTSGFLFARKGKPAPFSP